MDFWAAVDPSIASFRDYVFRPMASADVSDVIRFIREHYPDVVAGTESAFLEESFYSHQVALREGDHEREVGAFLAVSAGRELAAFLAVEYDRRGRVLHGRLALVDPRHRNSGLGQYLAGPFVECIAHALGAELVLSYATLKHPWSQALLEASGYRLVGLVPAHDRDLVSPGEVKRVWEALYAKPLISDGEILNPLPSNLRPAAAELFAWLGRSNVLD